MSNEKIPIQCGVQNGKQTRVRCEHTKRLIATIDAAGIHVWCKQEKASELITWEVIDAARKVQEQQQETCQEAC